MPLLWAVFWHCVRLHDVRCPVKALTRHGIAVAASSDILRLMLQGGVMDVQQGGSGGDGGGSFTVRLEAPANLWGAASASPFL